MSLADDVISYLETYLEIWQGPLAGTPFVVHPFQEHFIRGALADGCKEAVYTAGRGNAKTTLCAGIACAAIDDLGPLHVPGADILLIAASFDQGKLAFRHIVNFLEPYKDRFRIIDYSNKAEIHNRKSKAMLKVKGADAKKLHGGSEILTLADEMAQWPPTRVDSMLSAICYQRRELVSDPPV
ncbi:MAG: terminase large subunit [Gammaproteobacteria bacterium]|nr:terminase large subunit [Gammaproteobacteria bacterium]